MGVWGDGASAAGAPATGPRWVSTAYLTPLGPRPPRRSADPWLSAGGTARLPTSRCGSPQARIREVRSAAGAPSGG